MFNSLDHLNFKQQRDHNALVVSFDQLTLIDNQWVEVNKQITFITNTEQHKHAVAGFQNQHEMSVYNDWKGDEGFIKTLNHLNKCNMLNQIKSI